MSTPSGGEPKTGLGARLRALREHRALSLHQAANRLGIHFSTLGKYELGRRQPTVTTLGRLAAFYEVDPTHLMDMGPACKADAAQRMRQRPDLTVLVQVAGRLEPDAVMLLTDFLRAATDRAATAAESGPVAAAPGVPDVTAHAAEAGMPWAGAGAKFLTDRRRA